MRRDRREGHKKHRVDKDAEHGAKSAQEDAAGPAGLVDEDEGIVQQSADNGDFEQYLERELAAFSDADDDDDDDDDKDDEEGNVEQDDEEDQDDDDDNNDDDDNEGAMKGDEQDEEGEDPQLAAQQHAMELKELAASDPGERTTPLVGIASANQGGVVGKSSMSTS